MSAMPAPERLWPRTYLAVVDAVGLVAFALVLTVGLGVVGSLSAALLLSAAVAAGEFFPLRTDRAGGGETTFSMTFAFALLLTAGAAAAVLALAVSSVAADVAHRRPVWLTVFNGAQAALSLAVAGALLATIPDVAVFAPVPITATNLPAVVVAALVYFAVNLVLRAHAVGLMTATSPFDLVQRDLPFQVLSAALLLGLAPIVAGAAEQTLALIPLLVVPMAALHRSATAYTQREHQALHDPLTGLPNRALFADRVGQAVFAAARTRKPAAVMMIDLDGFKAVNDSLGHRTGDLLLVQVGERLRATLRQVDTVARLGGDEFGVVLRCVAGPAEARLVAQKLQTALLQPVLIDGETVVVEASIGVAMIPDHGRTPDRLIQRADAAMYAAKRGTTAQESR